MRQFSTGFCVDKNFLENLEVNISLTSLFPSLCNRLGRHQGEKKARR